MNSTYRYYMAFHSAYRDSSEFNGQDRLEPMFRTNFEAWNKRFWWCN